MRRDAKPEAEARAESAHDARAHGGHGRPVVVSAAAVSLPPDHPLAKRLPAIGLGLGVVALGAAHLLGQGTPRALAAYLTAYLFALSIALGGLFFVLLHHATRAGWSTVVRRLAEHLAATLPLFALLFLPIAFGLGELFPWVDPEPGDELLAAKAGYLNTGFVLVRAAICLGAWSLLAWWFRRRSLAQDESRDPAVTRRLQSLAAPGIIVFGITLTVAAFDWIMSLDPYWYSTIFGVYFFAGSTVAVLATLILIALALGGWSPEGALGGTVTPEHFHDLGKLLFAFVVFWAYIAFSQFMLIWYGNIPEETLWYAHRIGPGWEGVTIALAVGHFGVPFLFLLSRAVKRRAPTLIAGAVWLLAMHYLDLYWLVMPSFDPHGVHPHALDLLTLVGMVGLLAGTLGLLMRRRALVPLGDPRLPESLSFENV
jgi:hypothetical protein